MPEKPPYRPAGREQAEQIAIAALGHLVTDEDRLQAFLDVSGLDPSQIRAAAADPGFLHSVLAHVLSDEGLASGFAEEHRLSPEALARALHVLGGG